MMLLSRFLRAVIRSGDLCLIDHRGRDWRFGDGTAPHVSVQIHDKATQWHLLLNPELTVGEAYMRGTLTIERGTLFDFLDLSARNLEYVQSHPFQKVLGRFNRLLRRLQQHNPVGKAQRNVAHHYDLSDDLYDLFLDEDRQYSCAYFDSDSTDLEQAQINKKRHIAAKLLLNRRGLKVLDIGSGWGGLGMYLAQQTGAQVTGVTLSTEQHKVSQQRAADRGLAHQASFELRDYREKTGTFDRIVSVGMFEHVGTGHYTEYFKQVKNLLADDGVCLVHSIGRMDPPGTTNAWLRKYIFPGGYTPALSEVLAAVEKAGLWVTDIEILRLHYAETLRHWHDRFQAQREKARELYDEEFCRMWEFYLIGCEIGFRRRGQMVFQIQVAKRQDAVPLTREYIGEWERGVVAEESQAAE
ncbi:MAG: methyltransferase domain-containing protein [Alphaproteobacteria bacterium]|nr:methyltransferase domain-containing protein [Alphaproteobacteria bacterium]